MVSFNTHRSFGTNGLARTAAEIAALDPDIVLLQEIDRFYGRTGGVDQATWFADRLGLHGAFGANVIQGRGQYGTAILSRHDILTQHNTHLPNGPGGEQRGLLHATIDVGGREISIYNTHLQNRLVGLREAQARTIAGILARDPNPQIFGGDLNAGAGTPTLRALGTQLTDTWTQVGTGPDGTGPGGSRIDYVMASPDLTPTSATVHPSTVSDHNAVRTTYTLPTSTDCGTG